MKLIVNMKNQKVSLCSSVPKIQKKTFLRHNFNLHPALIIIDYGGGKILNSEETLQHSSTTFGRFKKQLSNN